MLRTRSPRKEKISNCYLHSNSLSNKMDNSLLAVRDINHKYIVVAKEHKEIPAGTFNMRIGGTTYVVCVHFSKESKDTLEDKVKRLMRDDVKAANF